ncbi:MAG: hypothetical protein IV092_24200 [Burkholderiaceae bacterium]|nr:hypothetical protein [Burkholderiaceae bacterium]
MFALALSCASGALPAASAPWYQWRSQFNGEFYCTQLKPGEGWVLADGPFRDAGCRQKGRPGERR